MSSGISPIGSSPQGIPPILPPRMDRNGNADQGPDATELSRKLAEDPVVASEAAIFSEALRKAMQPPKKEEPKPTTPERQVEPTSSSNNSGNPTDKPPGNNLDMYA